MTLQQVYWYLKLITRVDKWNAAPRVVEPVSLVICDDLIKQDFIRAAKRNDQEIYLIIR